MTVRANVVRWRGAATAAMLVLMSSGPAAAEVYTWTFRGVVGAGEDQTGVFGAPGSDPTGRRWKAVVTTDTSTPDAEITFGPNYSTIIGSLTSPVTVTFTLDGYSHVFGLGAPGPFGGVYGGQGQLEGPTVVYGFEADEYFTIQARDGMSAYADGVSYLQNDRIELGGVGLGQDFLRGPDFRTLPNLTAADGAVLFGYVALYTSIYDTVRDESLAYESAWASLRVTSVTPGVVPEPQAWALMILGFGAAGAMLRRYRFGRYATSTLPGICPNEP